MQKYLNHVYITEIVLFFLIIFGIVPRWFAFVLAGILIIYTLFASLEDTTVLFVRSIPLFIALPFTASFDNFNTWRILALIIFLKFLYSHYKTIKLNKLLFTLLIISCLSVFVAPGKHVALLRIIYFLNLMMVPIVIYYLPDKIRIIKNIAVPVIIVAIMGFVQLISTYFVDIYQFMSIWGEGIQCRQFGMQWCYIATHVGNTWFAYYGSQLSLRMFSLFTDSHTFPIFLLLGMPSLFLLKSESAHHKRWWIMIAFVYLTVILSGTRGIWAASLGVLILALLLWWRKLSVPASKSLVVFFLLFLIAWPIFNSPQFLLAHGGFGHRLKSVFDFNETSNKARIAIWKASLISIVHHPILGVGIGNFPIVLGEDLKLAKAGSSAHNLYLQVASEMGIFALIALIWFLWRVIKKLYANTDHVYFGSLLIFLAWVLIYVLTDVALFDERTFLITATVIAIGLTAGERQPRLS